MSGERSWRRIADVEYDRTFDGFDVDFNSSLMILGSFSWAALSPFTILRDAVSGSHAF